MLMPGPSSSLFSACCSVRPHAAGRRFIDDSDSDSDGEGSQQGEGDSQADDDPESAAAGGASKRAAVHFAGWVRWGVGKLLRRSAAADGAAEGASAAEAEQPAGRWGRSRLLRLQSIASDA